METNKKSKTYQLENITDFVLLTYLLMFLALYFDIRYLFSDTIVTGGDTASWYGVAHHMLTELLPDGRLMGWDMGNFCGYPNFSFYFIPPFLLAALPSYLFGLPLSVTLKLAIMTGIFLLPVTTYFGLRAMRYRFPVPVMGAGASFLIVFNESYTMFGGNALSTFAGEFCYMLAFALLPWFMGSVYRGSDTEKGAVKNGILLGLIGLSHLFVFIPAVLWVICLYFAKGKIRYIWKIAWIGFGVMAFWILPILAYRYPYTSPVYIIWRDFMNLRYTLTGLGAIFLMIGPSVALSCLRKGVLKFYFSKQLKSSHILMVLFTGMFAFTLVYLLSQYLILGKDLWHTGVTVPNLSQSLLGKSLAAQMKNWVIPISLFFSLMMAAAALWFTKKNSRFEKFCKAFGFLCFMTVLTVIIAELYQIISRSAGDEKVKAFFLKTAVMASVCGVFTLTAGWFFFFSKIVKVAVQHLISEPGPRTFGIYAGLIFGCVAIYFGSHFLNIPDIRFLPPVLFVLILMFFADVSGSFLSWCPVNVRISGAAIFCFLCVMAVMLGSAKPGQWYRYNNKGYEATPGYRDFVRINDYLRHSENTDPFGAPRVGYEKCDEYGRYGGDRVFESLPVFSGRQTMEGIHYASSMASKCVAFLQTEYSRDIKTPTSYIFSRMNPATLPAHLKLYNISQLILATTEAKRVISEFPVFKREADFGQLSVYRYLECDGKYVDVPDIRPVLYTSDTWAEDFYEWYKHPEQNDVLLVPEQFVIHEEDRAVFLNKTDQVSDLSSFRKHTLDTEDLSIETHLDHMEIRFTTNKIGIPHLVKVSYFPNWQVRGAHGVYPVSPHLMMVIPRESEVVLTYGKTFWEKVGWGITSFTWIAIFISSVLCLGIARPFAEKLSFLSDRFRFQELFACIEKVLTILRPWLLVLALLTAFLLIIFGALKRNLPVRTYIEGAKNYEIAGRLSRENKRDEAEKYYHKAIREMEKLLYERENHDLLDVILCILTTGISYEQLGQRDKAAEWYETIISEYPYSRYVGEACWKIALIRKYDRNQNLEAGMMKLRAGETHAGNSLLRKAIRQTREAWEYFQAAVEKDLYSPWAKHARRDMKADKKYIKRISHRIVSATREDDILEFFSPTRDVAKGSATPFFLDAKSDWSDTGIRVTKGEKLNFECRGTWAAAPEEVRQTWPDAGPEGHGDHPAEKAFSHLDSQKEMPGIPFGTLLGKIGNTIFPISDKEKVLMPESGRLFLVINDCPPYRYDNRGGLNIMIRKE
ncbi:hypothetical protein [Desulfonema magnum]|nr:hypothetical protein [Desulfonema magnum]